MNKKIGIPGYSLGENSFGVGKTYLEYLSEFGDVRILMPKDDIKELDLVVLPGGMDLNPRLYGQAPGFFTGNQDVHKQYFFEQNLPQYIEKGTPVFGICLGHQMLCAYFGGKLKQNLKYHAQSPDRWKPAHPIKPFGIEGKEMFGQKIEVNSHHHQGVLISGLDDSEIVPLFYSLNEEDANDPIVEVARHQNLPIYSVQYHPEELYDELAKSIIDKLLNP